MNVSYAESGVKVALTAVGMPRLGPRERQRTVSEAPTYDEQLAGDSRHLTLFRALCHLGARVCIGRSAKVRRLPRRMQFGAASCRWRRAAARAERKAGRASLGGRVGGLMSRSAHGIHPVPGCSRAVCAAFFRRLGTPLVRSCRPMAKRAARSAQPVRIAKSLIRIAHSLTKRLPHSYSTLTDLDKKPMSVQNSCALLYVLRQL